MKTKHSLLLALAVLATPVIAQERTAGQNYDAQVNWSTLSSKIDAVSNQNKTLAALLDKITACNNQNKIFNPADPAADPDTGCTTIKGKSCTVDWATTCGPCGCKVRSMNGSGGETTPVLPPVLVDGQIVTWKLACTTNNKSTIQCVDGTTHIWSVSN
jgi:hypothetical protein